MKKLILYYSFEGNTHLIAQLIAEQTGATLLALQPQQEIMTKSPLKYVLGGKQSLFKAKPPLQPLTTNPADYDLIFVGTPVWAWTFAPVFNTFFAEHQLTGKSCALFCCHGGGPGKTLNNLKQHLAGNKILGETNFLEPLRAEREQVRTAVQQWLSAIDS